MVAYGVVELVMDAVVGAPVDPDIPDPTESSYSLDSPTDSLTDGQTS